MDISTLIIEIIGGVIGGNAVGAMNKPGGMGVTLNSMIGAVGGIIGGYGLHSANFIEGTGLGSYMIGSVLGGLGLVVIAGMFKH
jgi:uncharacterized membrane protein YeaQ/YmgE (transglycosylase-associated protein family)